MTKILVCGGRRYGYKKIDGVWEKDVPVWNDAFRTLDLLADRMTKPITVISGRAKGGDEIGEAWATARNHSIEPYPADWDKYKRKAGILRNRQMLKEGRPDYVVAFPGNTGTENMVKISHASKTPVFRP